jgi:hypothetical protein
MFFGPSTTLLRDALVGCVTNPIVFVGGIQNLSSELAHSVAERRLGSDPNKQR